LIHWIDRSRPVEYHFEYNAANERRCLRDCQTKLSTVHRASLCYSPSEAIPMTEHKRLHAPE